MTRDFRNHPHYRADDSVRWIFLADLADEQGQRVHGESAPTEFLPRWPRPRGRYRDFVTGLPDARGCGSSSNTYALVRSNRSATLRDSHFGGVLLLSAAANGYSSQWSGRLGLRRGSDSRCWGCHAWCWVVAVSTTELGLLFQ